MNLIQKFINIFTPKQKLLWFSDFNGAVRAVDKLALSGVSKSAPISGWLVFSCNCGQSQNVPVDDISIDDMTLWVCPKPKCRQKISLIERRPK